MALTPLRIGMHPPGLFVCRLSILFFVAIISLAGATPVPRPRGERHELAAGDFGKRLRPLARSQISARQEQHKRQIFREQVSPHTGGKIPEDAFRADRLALNKLQQAGFSVPDGTLLQWRGHGGPGHQGHHGHGPQGHPDGHTHNADPHVTVIKVVQSEDGRYTPTEGAVNSQHPNTVDSTYILRTPAGWDQHASQLAQLVGLQRPVGPPLQIPTLGGSPPRRPFGPPPRPPPPLPPSPPPPPHQQPAPTPPPAPRPQQDDVNLTPPFPSAALQPPPNVGPASGPLFHHKPHPLELPQPPKSFPAPSVSPTPPPPRFPPSRKFHFGLHGLGGSLGGLDGLGGLGHHDALSSLVGAEPHHAPGRDLGLFGSGFESSHGEASFLSDPFLLDDDWASELPAGLLSPEQLAALYNSDHEERLQHLHSLAPF